MRILLLNTDPDPPADARRTRSARMRGVAAGLLRAGHLVDGALAARADHAEFAPLQSRGLTLHALPRRAGRDVCDRLMGACRPDLVIEHLAPLAPHAAEAAAHLGVLHLYEIEARLQAPAISGRARDGAEEMETCLRRGFCASRGAVVPSPEVAEWVRLHAPREFELQQLPSWSGADSPEPPSAAHREWARALIGARTGEFLVGFCGSFKPWNDLETLVAAMSRLRPAVPSRLVLSGDGPARNALLALTHRHKVMTVFSGAVARDEARALMAACDVLAIPYARSGTDFSPLKLVEALNTGRPIVATECGSTRRVLVEGTTGILVPAADAVAMAEAFERLATQPALRERLSAAARGRAVEHYSWDVAAERLLAFAARHPGGLGGAHGVGHLRRWAALRGARRIPPPAQPAR